jgi:cell division protein FtsW
MSDEARWVVFISGTLIAFGLAVLYSASSIDAMTNPSLQSPTGTFFLTRQLTGLLAGAVVFAVAAKVDAERLYKLAWPLMWIAIVTMIGALIVPESTSWPGR